MRARSVLAIILLAALATLSVPPPSAMGTGPRVLVIYRNGPVSVDGSALASLDLAGGDWVLLATATVIHDSVSPQGVDCGLNAGWDFDGVVLSNGRTARGMALMVVHHADAPFTATLTCSTLPGAAADLFGIRLAAYRVDRLTNRQLPPGNAWTYGSGSPEAIAGWSDGPLPMGDGTASTLASLSLPRGRWWVLAKLYTQAPGEGATKVDCRVQLGNAANGYQEQQVLDQLGRNEQSVMLLQHARRLTAPGAARVRCEASRPTTATFLKIVAFRAGRLTVGGTTNGSGAPTVRMASRTGPVTVPAGMDRRTIATLSVPAGNWVVVATGTARNASGGTAGYLDCQLASGVAATRIPDVDLTPGKPHGRAPVMLMSALHADAPITIRLRCRAGLAPLRMSEVRISAISTPSMLVGIPAEPVA